MGIPQIIIVIYSLALLSYAHDHGKPREGKHNFWVALCTTAAIFGLLIWGGFFT